MFRNRLLATALAGAVLASGALVLPVANNSAQAASGNQCGDASWYALTSRTASGEMMNPAKLTAAHKTLPFGTKLKVTNKNNGRSVVVRINDRGPFIKGRVIDLSKAAAREIGMIRSGHAPICFTRL
ncbi:MAG: septal ring lytic transglycosylase RlpA family protein [Pseudomonadota bacterium]